MRQTADRPLRIFDRSTLMGLFAVVVWGASFVATRVAEEALDPPSLIGIRLWMGALLLALVLFARGETLLPTRRDRPVCIFLGGVLAAHLLLQAYGLEKTSAIRTSWIIGSIPIPVALGAHWLRQQRLTALGWLGVAAGAIGVAVVTAVKPANFADARFGDLLQLVSTLTWTVYTLAAAGPLARSGALRVTTFSMAVAAAIATCATIWTGHWHGPLTLRPLLAIGFLGLLCSGVAYYMWLAATHAQGPARIGALLYLEPFVTVVTAAIVMSDERITLNTMLGGLCVLFGVWLVARGTTKGTVSLDA